MDNEHIQDINVIDVILSNLFLSKV